MGSLTEKAQNILDEKINKITPGNIKSGVTIFDITGNYTGPGINNQDKTISPSTNIQNIVADYGYTGLNQVTINAVTSSIDSNIQPNYIANGINILGVTGTFEGSGGGGSGIPTGAKFGFSTFTDAPNIDTSNYTDTSWMFYQCRSLRNIPNFDLSNCADVSSMFQECISLYNIPNFNTSRVIIMNSMFSACESLVSVPNFNTDNVYSFESTFAQCSSLGYVPNFNTSNAEYMSHMFTYCNNITDIPEFDTHKVRSLSCFIQGCNNLSNAAIQNVINMCLNATNYDGVRSLDINSWETPFYDTKFDNSYYQNRWAELDKAGWTY